MEQAAQSSNSSLIWFLILLALGFSAVALGLVLYARNQRKKWEKQAENDHCEDSGPHSHHERPGGDHINDVQPLVTPGGRVLHRTEVERHVSLPKLPEANPPPRSGQSVLVEHHHHHMGPAVVPIVLGGGGFEHLGPHHTQGHHHHDHMYTPLQDTDPHRAITAQHAKIEAPDETFKVASGDAPSPAPVEQMAPVNKRFTLPDDADAAAPPSVEEAPPSEESFTLPEDEGAAAPAPVEQKSVGFDPTFSVTEDEGAAPAPVEQSEPSEPTQTYTRPTYEEATPAQVEREPSEPQSYSIPDNDDRDTGGGQEDSGSSDSSSSSDSE